MIMEFFLILLVFGVSLFIVGALTKNMPLVLIAGALLLINGIFVQAYGIERDIGSTGTIADGASGEKLVNLRTVWVPVNVQTDSSINMISWVLMLFGVFGTLGAWFFAKHGRG